MVDSQQMWLNNDLSLGESSESLIEHDEFEVNLMDERSNGRIAPRKIMIPSSPDARWAEGFKDSSTPILMIALGLILAFTNIVVNGIIMIDIDQFMILVFINYIISMSSMILLIVGVFLQYDLSKKRRMIMGGETNLPTIAAILLIAGALIGLFFYAIPLAEMVILEHDVNFDSTWFIIYSVLGIMPIFAGVLSWKRRGWIVAIILGSLGVIVGFIPIILGVVLVILSKSEFNDGSRASGQPV